MGAFASEPWARAVAIVLGSLAAAGLLGALLRGAVHALVRRTQTELDDVVVSGLRRPLAGSVVLVGLAWANDQLALGAGRSALVVAGLQSVAVLLWAGAALRIGGSVLVVLGQRSRPGSLVQARTVPVFEMLLKLAVAGATLYLGCLAWQIDLTAWLASAGIIGIAIGFAARDSLANLFSGLFIIADAPYQVGDFIVLAGGLRGRVTRIGLRSTRVLTRDDIEVTVPNAMIGASQIINETGGPDPRQRVRVAVDCAYGSDVDQVEAVLLGCPDGVDGVAEQPSPEVRLLDFGSSGLRFELRVWISEPAVRGRVLHDLRVRIYKAFLAAGIEIPFSQHDVHIRSFPAARG